MEIEKDECARCGYKTSKGSLHRHHIDQNHDNDELGNVIILCSNCHSELHHDKWKLSDIGIFGFDTKFKRNAFKEAQYLDKQNRKLREENIKLKAELTMIKSSSGYAPEMELKRKVALYSFLTLFGYKVRDAITFFEHTPNEFFEKVIGEHDKYTRDLVSSIYDAFRDNDLRHVQVYLNDRQTMMKNSKVMNSELTELAYRLPLD